VQTTGAARYNTVIEPSRVAGDRLLPRAKGGMQMGFLDRFFKKPSPAPKPAESLIEFGYGVAYYYLPQLIFADAKRVTGYFDQYKERTGEFIYGMAALARKRELSHEEGDLFKAYRGKLTDEEEYFLVEFPTPPPNPDITKPGSTLAPFFAALILRNDAPTEPQYYILGQRPFGGTTLRCVTADGTNANLGEGPVPEVEWFIQALRQRGERSAAAAHRFTGFRPNKPSDKES